MGAGLLFAGVVLVSVVVDVFLILGVKEVRKESTVVGRWSPEGTGSYGRGIGGKFSGLNGDGSLTERMYGSGMVGTSLPFSGTWTLGLRTRLSSSGSLPYCLSRRQRDTGPMTYNAEWGHPLLTASTDQGPVQMFTTDQEAPG